MYKNIRYYPSGDACLLMEFGNTIDPEINKKIRNMVSKLEKLNPDYINEILPTYRSISIFYNPLKISYKDLVEKLNEIGETIVDNSVELSRIIEIPTVYGGEYGPDIEFVAKENNLTVEEVIEIHTSVDYLVYMLGFTPGFPYLGGLDTRIHTPRLQKPRVKIPAGSTGIAGSQTGVYPIDSPGGWQLIGRTPVKLYDPINDPPVLLKAGDYVRFVRVSQEEYKKIEEKISKNQYRVKIITGDVDEE